MYFDRTDVPRMNGVGLYRYELSDRAREFPGISALRTEMSIIFSTICLLISSLPQEPTRQHHSQCQRENSSLYWNRSVQFYPAKEAFMNIKVGLVCFIHCVGQSLTPRVWVTVVWRLYQVSSISHQRQKPMKARSVWHPTFISPHLSSDWSWARSNYMNNRQRGINQRRHLKIMREQRMINYYHIPAELAGIIQLYWRG